MPFITTFPLYFITLARSLIPNSTASERSEMNFELALYKVNQEQFIQNKQQIVQQLNKKILYLVVLSKNNINGERFNQ